MDFSDEDRDVDIESDDEVDSTGKNSGQQFQTQSSRRHGNRNTISSKHQPAEKRAHHNALERKRRDHIKDSFSGLRDSIPSLGGEKVQASRAQILKRAADYIQYMRKKNVNHQLDIDKLKSQNQQLESQIRTMEKAKTTGNFSASMMDNALVTNARGNSISAFDGGSGSESSDSESESSHHDRRKKMKTVSPATSSSGT